VDVAEWGSGDTERFVAEIVVAWGLGKKGAVVRFRRTANKAGCATPESVGSSVLRRDWCGVRWSWASDYRSNHRQGICRASNCLCGPGNSQSCGYDACNWRQNRSDRGSALSYCYSTGRKDCRRRHRDYAHLSGGDWWNYHTRCFWMLAEYILCRAEWLTGRNYLN
jgi:hypothetical protein